MLMRAITPRRALPCKHTFFAADAASYAFAIKIIAVATSLRCYAASRHIRALMMPPPLMLPRCRYATRYALRSAMPLITPDAAMPLDIRRLAMADAAMLLTVACRMRRRRYDARLRDDTPALMRAGGDAATRA